MTHDELTLKYTHIGRFLAAQDRIKAGDYEGARKLYDDPEAQKTDLVVIERRIERHRAANANRSHSEEL